MNTFTQNWRLATAPDLITITYLFRTMDELIRIVELQAIKLGVQPDEIWCSILDKFNSALENKQCGYISKNDKFFATESKVQQIRALGLIPEPYFKKYYREMVDLNTIDEQLKLLEKLCLTN